MSTKLNIIATDTNDKTLQTTVTGINPDATASNIAAYAEGLIGLTDNTYVSASKVTKEDVANDTAATNLGVSKSVVTEAELDASAQIVKLTYRGTGTLSVEKVGDSSWFTATLDAASKTVTIAKVAEATATEGALGVVLVKLTNDGTYAAQTAAIKVSA